MITPWRWRPRVMKQLQKRKAKGRIAKSVLRLPDLEIAKSAVLSSLSCPDAQRGYRHAIDEFVDWYCSEPRLSFSKTVVLRYRMHLESRHLAPGTINLRLGAVRRLAYEAADCGLHAWEKSPDTGRLRVAILFSGDLSRVGVTVQRPGNGNLDRDNSN